MKEDKLKNKLTQAIIAILAFLILFATGCAVVPTCGQHEVINEQGVCESDFY